MGRRKFSVREVLRNESASGFLILIASALGLLVANSPLSDTYFKVLDIDFSLGSGVLAINLTIQKVVNYLLMTLFFFVIGLEIKRELTTGHLASVKKALMPLLAALDRSSLEQYQFVRRGTSAGGWRTVRRGRGRLNDVARLKR